MKRESGYYWVKHADEWQISRYYKDTECWTMIGTDDLFKDSEFKEIGHSIDRLDSERLLKKYIQWVGECEGTNFISDQFGRPMTDFFTNEEIDKLEELERHKNGTSH